MDVENFAKMLIQLKSDDDRRTLININDLPENSLLRKIMQANFIDHVTL